MALPERGETADRARALLEQAGLAAEPGDDDVRFFRLPERDIGVYTVHGGLHLALTGNLGLAEASVAARTVVDLDSTHHELVLLAAADGPATPTELTGRRVATPYPQLVRRHCAMRGIFVEKVVALDPAEPALELGIADAVAVVVPAAHDRTGPPTGLRRLDVIQPCRLVAVEGDDVDDESVLAARARFLDRLRAARRAASVCLVQFECPPTDVEMVLDGLPSLRAPEVGAPPEGECSVVRVLVAADEGGAMVERLRARGGREILTFRPGLYEPGAAPAADRAALASSGAGLPGPRGPLRRD